VGPGDACRPLGAYTRALIVNAGALGFSDVLSTTACEARVYSCVFLCVCVYVARQEPRTHSWRRRTERGWGCVSQRTGLCGVNWRATLTHTHTHTLTYTERESGSRTAGGEARAQRVCGRGGLGGPGRQSVGGVGREAVEKDNGAHRKRTGTWMLATASCRRWVPAWTARALSPCAAAWCTLGRRERACEGRERSEMESKDHGCRHDKAQRQERTRCARLHGGGGLKAVCAWPQ
jgi:hypothetical protein